MNCIFLLCIRPAPSISTQARPPLVSTLRTAYDTLWPLPRARYRSPPPSCPHLSLQKSLRRTIRRRSAPSPSTTRGSSSSPPLRTKRCSSTTARLASTKNNSIPRNTESISPALRTNPPPSFTPVRKKTVSQAQRVAEGDIQRPFVRRWNSLSLPPRQQLPQILQRTQKEVSPPSFSSLVLPTKNRNQSDFPRNVASGRHLPFWSDRRHRSAVGSSDTERLRTSRPPRASLTLILETSQGLLNIAGHPSATYDPAGLVFAVALNLRSSVLFYDQRFYDQAPFISVAVVDIELSRNNSQPRIPMITSLKFSNDGKYLLLGTGGDYLYVLGAFSGALVVRLDCQSLAPDRSDVTDRVL